MAPFGKENVSTFQLVSSLVSVTKRKRTDNASRGKGKRKKKGVFFILYYIRPCWSKN